MSFGEMVIWVDAKTLENPLLSEKVWRFEMCEKNPYPPLLIASGDGLTTGDTEFSRVAMAKEANVVYTVEIVNWSYYIYNSQYFHFSMNKFKRIDKEIELYEINNPKSRDWFPANKIKVQRRAEEEEEIENKKWINIRWFSLDNFSPNLSILLKNERKGKLLSTAVLYFSCNGFLASLITPVPSSPPSLVIHAQRIAVHHAPSHAFRSPLSNVLFCFVFFPSSFKIF